MALHYDLTEVNRDAWPDGGIPLYEFCVMMMVVGVGKLKTDEDLKKLENRALLFDALKGFGWKHRDKKKDQMDMIDLIPLMKGLKTNVSNETTTWFFKKLKQEGVL